MRKSWGTFSHWLTYSTFVWLHVVVPDAKCASTKKKKKPLIYVSHYNPVRRTPDHLPHSPPISEHLFIFQRLFSLHESNCLTEGELFFYGNADNNKLNGFYDNVCFSSSVSMFRSELQILERNKIFQALSSNDRILLDSEMNSNFQSVITILHLFYTLTAGTNFVSLLLWH